MAKRRKTVDLDAFLTEDWHADSDERACAHPECDLPGDFRAPRSRERVRDYLWFCLEHVRDYNSRWNYYADMSEDEIEADRRGTTYWHRPTWPLNGGRGAEKLRDGFGFFDEEAAEEAHRRTVATDSEDTDALAIMNLSPPLTADAIKRRYKELVKQHHPDANGGDKLAEERLKAINQAYATLMQSVGP
jgi:hypothetical protein